MIILIISVLLGLYLSIKYMWNDAYDIGDYILSTFLTCIILLISIIIGALISYSLPMKTEENVVTYKIVSLQDNNNLKGDYFIGSGRFEGKMKYSFYYESDGGFKLKQIDYKNATIIYSDSIRIEQFGEKEVVSFINYFAFDDLTDENYMKFKIFVPKGTIKSNFSLDAEQL